MLIPTFVKYTNCNHGWGPSVQYSHHKIQCSIIRRSARRKRTHHRHRKDAHALYRWNVRTKSSRIRAAHIANGRRHKPPPPHALIQPSARFCMTISASSPWWVRVRICPVWIVPPCWRWCALRQRQRLVAARLRPVAGAECLYGARCRLAAFFVVVVVGVVVWWTKRTSVNVDVVESTFTFVATRHGASAPITYLKYIH